MDQGLTVLEEAFAELLELAEGQAPLQDELRRSRREFFVDGTHDDPSSERRHLEWFLLERPSATLGDVPVRALEEAWRARLSPALAEGMVALLQSMPGAFEVTSVLPGEGVWVRDLFSLGEHPIIEPEAAPELAPGDLLVGRIFPVRGGETFRLSAAVCCFREPRLLQAVRGDLEHMRQARRGVLRVQQLELERLFFRAPPVAGDRPIDRETLRERVRQALQDELPRAEIASLLDAVRAAAASGRGALITEVLNRLAFETCADLGELRRLLVELWSAERSELQTCSAPPGHEGAVSDVHAALAAFDRGRAEGRDLEQLFCALEADLGVEPDEPEEDDERVPDFPGVVGAVIEEFLWDVEREAGADQARRLSGLRRLGRYAADLGVFEELGGRHLLDFSARWLLDQGELAGPEDAHEVLDGLAAFCRWSEERHRHPLWTEFGATLEALRAPVARLVLRSAARTSDPHESGELHRLVRLGEQDATVADLAGGERRVPLGPGEGEHLQVGDLVRVPARADARLGPAYPGDLLRLLR
jgi:hypothetical protein